MVTLDRTAGISGRAMGYSALSRNMQFYTVYQTYQASHQAEKACRQISPFLEGTRFTFLISRDHTEIRQASRPY